MEPINDAQQLLSIGGVAAAIYVFIELFVKPWLRARYGIGPGGETDNPADLRRYKAVMNAVAGVLGVVFASLAAVAFPPEAGLSLAVFLTAFLVGIGGAFVAIGVHIAATNINKQLQG